MSLGVLCANGHYTLKGQQLLKWHSSLPEGPTVTGPSTRIYWALQRTGEGPIVATHQSPGPFNLFI